MYFIASQKTKELPQERLKHGMIVVSEFKIKDHDFWLHHQMKWIITWRLVLKINDTELRRLAYYASIWYIQMLWKEGQGFH